MPIISHSPLRSPGVTTLMAVGDYTMVGESLTDKIAANCSPIKCGLALAGAAAIVGSKRPVLWALVGAGISLLRSR